jgi:aflatoxin B1 aldehyde reductase
LKHFLGGLYANLYVKESITAATDKALEVADQHGIGGHAAALRWTAHHSALSAEYGDSIILGASSAEQLESNIDMIEQGPLPADVVAALESLYKELGDEVAYHF